VEKPAPNVSFQQQHFCCTRKTI